MKFTAGLGTAADRRSHGHEATARLSPVSQFLTLGLLVLLIGSVAVLIPWPSRAIRNQRKIVRLLASARLESTGNKTIRIQRIVLAGSVFLTPDQEQLDAGYVVRAHVKSPSFTVEAKPLEVRETGGFSFFRDDAGVIRFEPELGKVATDQSRPWAAQLKD